MRQFVIKQIRWGVLIGVVALAVSACGGNNDDKPTQTPESTATEESQDVTATLAPDQPAATSTAYVLPTDDLFTEAASIARVDLATRLDASVTQIEIMDPDTPLFLEEPPLCPEVADQELFNVYLRHGRDVYPYQFYTTGGIEGLVVEQCDDVLVDDEVLYVPTPNSRADVVQLVQADLLAQGINPDTGRYIVRQMTWTDEALGCRRDPDAEEPQPALIDGYLVSYDLDGITYEYHTDASGEQIVLCGQPQGHASIAAFIFSLKTDENYELVETDEVARYEGLDAEGQIVLLTPEEYRVGLFQFETPQDARAAAAKIDDVAVSHIFVSGYVLVVQEENSPEVYDILRTYAEEVRTPVLERQDEQIEETEEPEE